MQSRYFLKKKKDLVITPEIVVGVIAEIEEITCPICLDICTDITSIDCCNHKFCFTCLSKWGMVINKCPLDKKCFSLATCITDKSKVFVPQLRLEIEEEEDDEDDNEDDNEDNDSYASNNGFLNDESNDSNHAHGYELDDFLVNDEALDFEDYEDETEIDKILDKADEKLIHKKQKREHLPEISDSSYIYSSSSSSSSVGRIEIGSSATIRQETKIRISFDSFLSNYELKE